MTDELKIKEEHECFCKSKGFRKFFVIALGTFVGVFAALCLFCALHRPQMPFMGPNPYMMGPAFYHNCNCPCHNKMMKKFIKQEKEFKNELKKELEHDND